MPSDKMRGITGKLTLRLFDSNHNLKSEQTTDNLIVDVGLNHVADQLAAQAEAQMSHIAVGTDNTIPSTDDTALGSEIERIVLDDLFSSNSLVTYIANFDAGEGTGALVEAGIFNAASGGVMLARSTFDTKNKGPLDTLEVTWEITIL